MRASAASKRLGFALAGLALGACNAVLGIDEAEPRGGAAPTGVLAVPIAQCDAPTAACAQCISANCQSLGQCLSNHDCRDALDGYRGCLGASCNNPDCFAKLEASAAGSLAQCVKTECPGCAQGAPLVSSCDLYCACMQQPLPATATATTMVTGKTCESWNGASLPWRSGDVAACKEACAGLQDLTSVSCRWSHCQLATGDETGSHCQHAISEANCPLMQAQDGECTDKKRSGFGCKKDAECCSQVCTGNICAN